MISNMKNETRQFNEFGFEILTDDEKKQEDVRLAVAIKRFFNAADRDGVQATMDKIFPGASNTI